MSLQNRIINYFTDSMQIQRDSLHDLCELIELASQRIVATLLADGKVFSCGNGRSALSAQLLCVNLLNQFERDRPSLPAIALTTDASNITAIANDYRFDEIFSKPLKTLAQSNDILVIYADGTHPANLVKAIEVGHSKGLAVIALIGEKNEMISGTLNERDLEIRVPSANAAHTCETHILLTHSICDLIDHQLFDSQV